MLEDFSTGSILQPANADAANAAKFILDRKPDYFSYPDWKRLDELEQQRGKACGRPRVKFTSVEEMKQALGK
jgi:ferredoxin--NADP+ reductase